MIMHATARFTVRYGERLRFAGRDLPRPAKVRVGTRHGRVPVRVYRSPEADDSAAHVHFHGGAWLMRYPGMDDWWCRYLAATTGRAVLNVDFRTGPYVAFPVAQEQCHDVTAWAAGRYGRVSVGGFSSGGGLAASVCLQARDSGSCAPRLQVLGVPALDLASELPTGPGMISPELRALVRRVYFPDPATRSHPYASPALAPDLSGLPPALVLTAGRDTLRHDGETYVRRLGQAGVAVTHHETPGVDHYFLTEDPVRARSTMAMVADAIAAS
ncbi:alpha/beta hydrolase fold domain-containing protein [Actinokineospora bangkokensis]|uniref:Carboxylesterase n=1 Tax=Actinokineospora bangkokensis TaxID=1193682 RepID=A0A1Q9LP83_9PSEU|nr:alpha/beta hydrolase fold domain-containing protein [Actinokineospora bangkokensis]OLR93866.1 carboxylesterase [Actinokineospora bangkokensis]